MDFTILNRTGWPTWKQLAMLFMIAIPLGDVATGCHAAEQAEAGAVGLPGWQVAPFKLQAITPRPNAAQHSPAENGRSREPDATDGISENSGNADVIELLQPPRELLTVVCFLGAECPLARLYSPRLNALAEEFADRGVRFIGVNSNSQDSLADVRTFARDHGVAFPIGKDYQNTVADQFGAERTPEVFVIDATLTIRYRGRIDDQYEPGLARVTSTRHDLHAALEELLAGQPVSQPVTAAPGCLIGRARPTKPQPGAPAGITYAKQVSRVLINHCVECHRAGEIGPFALTDYDEVVGWADTMLETIDDGRMPPWHATGAHGTFANAREMPESDKQLLRDWVAAGVPFGDPSDLPEVPATVPGWQLPREPDLILEMRPQPFVVPPTGTVEYQYFVVDPGFKEDKWITAAQIVPGARSVVHHAICFVRPPDGTEFRGVGWVTAYVPGQRTMALPPGAARRVPAGSKLVFQMHYTPTGKAQPDLTRIGMLFARDEEVTHEVFTVVAIDQEFEIPPHAANHAVTVTVDALPASSELFAIVPHMHVRGKSMQISTRRGDTEQLILDVPRYDFNWQHSYFLAKPLPLTSVDAIKMTATFDNSANNPTNPDPTQFVTWGDQTWQEMAIAFLAVSEPRDAAQRQPRRRPAKQTVDKTAQVEALVQDFLRRFDVDGNGNVDRDETPLSFQQFRFNRFDKDRDGRLTPEEIRRAARNQL